MPHGEALTGRLANDGKRLPFFVTGFWQERHPLVIPPSVRPSVRPLKKQGVPAACRACVKRLGCCRQRPAPLTPPGTAVGPRQPPQTSARRSRRGCSAEAGVSQTGVAGAVDADAAVPTGLPEPPRLPSERPALPCANRMTRDGGPPAPPPGPCPEPPLRVPRTPALPAAQAAERNWRMPRPRRGGCRDFSGRMHFRAALGWQEGPQTRWLLGTPGRKRLARPGRQRGHGQLARRLSPCSAPLPPGGPPTSLSGVTLPLSVKSGHFPHRVVAGLPRPAMQGPGVSEGFCESSPHN